MRKQPHPQARQQPIPTRCKLTPQKSPPTPKRKQRKRLDTNITDIQNFERVALVIDKLLQRYLDSPRRNYRSLASDLRERVSKDDAVRLHPCNAHARIRFAKIVQRHIVRLGIPSLKPLNWVTIAPGLDAVPIAQARNFNLKPLIGRVRQALGDVPFLAFIEAGHYRPSRGLGRHRGDIVSWHVHVITWGVPLIEIAKKLRPFKSRHLNFVGRRCVHIKPIQPEDVLQKALYGSKGQVKSYRHYLRRENEIDPETGEVMHRMGQSKEKIRTGDLVKMVEVFGKKRIDDLIFGNGLGTNLANIIRYEAMLPYCEWAQREIDDGREEKSELPFVATYRKLGNRLRREHGEDFLGDVQIGRDRSIGLSRDRHIAKNRCQRK